MSKPTERTRVTPVQRRILNFFQEHPHAVETVRGISTWLGDETEVIQEALESLVGRKWLTADQTSAVRGYVLTRDERLLTQIQELTEAS